MASSRKLIASPEKKVQSFKMAKTFRWYAFCKMKKVVWGKSPAAMKWLQWMPRQSHLAKVQPIATSEIGVDLLQGENSNPV